MSGLGANVYRSSLQFIMTLLLARLGIADFDRPGPVVGVEPMRPGTSKIAKARAAFPPKKSPRKITIPN